MKCSFAWRGQLYFFTGLMFGLRHAGLAAQQVTSAVHKAHREAGLNSQQSTVPVFQFAKFSNFLVYTLYSIYVLSLSVSVLSVSVLRFLSNLFIP